MTRRRVRPVLLGLLWVWALLVFVVVDLFRNVPEFDGVRPRATIYRAMRYAAHKMVGEPYYEGGFGRSCVASLSVAQPGRKGAVELQTELDAVGRSRVSGDVAGLLEIVHRTTDPRVRIAALEGLVAASPERARSGLINVVDDEGEQLKVRREAARLLGRLGTGSYAEIERLLGSALPDRVKAGAVRGLAEIGSRAAATRLVQLATTSQSRLRRSALKAIHLANGHGALAVLTGVAADRTHATQIRVAALQSLGNSRHRDSVDEVMAILAPGTRAPADVRIAAIEALGKIGDRRALALVSAAVQDSSTAVANSARIAKARLEHIREN